MEKQEIESKIHELKVKQSDHFKKKKADRNPEELTAIREELNGLKEQVSKLYRKKK